MPKVDGVTKESIVLHMKELHYLHRPLPLVVIAKSRKLLWSAQVACTGETMMVHGVGTTIMAISGF